MICINWFILITSWRQFFCIWSVLCLVWDVLVVLCYHVFCIRPILCCVPARYFVSGRFHVVHLLRLLYRTDFMLCTRSFVSDRFHVVYLPGLYQFQSSQSRCGLGPSSKVSIWLQNLLGLILVGWKIKISNISNLLNISNQIKHLNISTAGASCRAGRTGNWAMSLYNKTFFLKMLKNVWLMLRVKLDSVLGVVHILRNHG